LSPVIRKQDTEKFMAGEGTFRRLLLQQLVGVASTYEDAAVCASQPKEITIIRNKTIAYLGSCCSIKS
jgi:hypothetical protein